MTGVTGVTPVCIIRLYARACERLMRKVVTVVTVVTGDVLSRNFAGFTQNPPDFFCREFGLGARFFFGANSRNNRDNLSLAGCSLLKYHANHLYDVEWTTHGQH